MSNLSRIKTSAIAVLVFILLPFIPAHAHKVMVFALVQGDTAYVDGYFADGKKAQGSLVEVFDETGNRLLEGKTDSNGSFTFPVQEKTALKIVLTASMGHKAEFIIPEGDITQGSPETTFTKDKSPAGLAREGTAGECISPEQIRTIIEQELDKKLKPLIHAICQSQAKGPKLHDIISGIGYIAGVMGIIMYFRSRHTSKR